MPPGLHRQVSGLFHGRDEGGERGLQEGAGRGHGERVLSVTEMDGDAS